MSRSNVPHATTQPPVHRKQYDIRSVWTFENDWHTKFCSCRSTGRWCFSCFCCCCMGCKVAKHLGETTIIGCFPCSIPYLRTKLRTARRIEGSCCGDCCSAIPCCLALTTTQISYELESQGMWDPPKADKHKRDHRDHHDRQNHYNDYN